MAHPLARCRRNRKKGRKNKKSQKKRLHPKNGGPSKRAGSTSTFFWQKKTGFSKSSKTPIFIAFPEKMGGHHFFSKRLCFKKDTFRRAKKNDNFLVPFRQQCLRRCQSKKKRGGLGGGAKPPPPKRKREAESWHSCCCFCCCWLLFFVFLVLFLLLLYL